MIFFNNASKIKVKVEVDERNFLLFDYSEDSFYSFFNVMIFFDEDLGGSSWKNAEEML